ncbi:MAG: Mur ligase domain-containing protein, partial [Bacteroidales bacterium]
MELELFYNSIFKKHSRVCTDTRKVEQGAIFFALKGENFDANAFAEEALNKGCSYAVIDNNSYKKSEQYIVVEDVLSFLQQLAQYHRKKMNIPVIGITG